MCTGLGENTDARCIAGGKSLACSEELKGQGIAARFGSTLYSSSCELLDREEVDFAVAFGRHFRNAGARGSVAGEKVSVNGGSYMD